MECGSLFPMNSLDATNFAFASLAIVGVAFCALLAFHISRGPRR